MMYYLGFLMVYFTALVERFFSCYVLYLIGPNLINMISNCFDYFLLEANVLKQNVFLSEMHQNASFTCLNHKNCLMGDNAPDPPTPNYLVNMSPFHQL